MTEYKCLTSVYFEEVVYMPGEVLELNDNIAKLLLKTQSIEAIKAKDLAKAEQEAKAVQELPLHTTEKSEAKRVSKTA